MNILGIGPFEILLILIVAFVLIGPKDLSKTGRTVGHFLRKVVTSSEWHAIRHVAHEIQTTPNRLIREAGIEEIEQLRKEMNTLGKSGPGDGAAVNDLDFEELEGYAAWIRQPAPRRILPNPAPTSQKPANPEVSRSNSQSNAE